MARAGRRVLAPVVQRAAVPQKLGLMEELTVEENIEYPARLAGALEDRSDTSRS